MILGAPTASSQVPPVNRRTLRRTLVWAAVAGVLGAAVAIWFGQPLAALLGWVGLGLGALNARMAQVSVARY
ncbi:MAG: hypothetical protein QOC83_1361, partial [Pseudonocardiales bacterium]|nr:hypothetical protein [Pseudonocardiales bacterium]